MKKVKIILGVLLYINAIFLLTSCKNDEIDTIYSAQDIAYIIANSQENLASMTEISADDELYISYIEKNYLLYDEVIEDGVILYASNGVFADEIAVFEFSSQDDAEDAISAIEEYKFNRAGNFTGYVPEEEKVANDGIISQKGEFIAMIICDNPEKGEELFIECFSENPPEIPSEIDFIQADIEKEIEVIEEVEEIEKNTVQSEEYSRDDVMYAWETGDSSNLNEKNKAVYDITSEFINSFSDDMTEYEKELAIHDFIVTQTQYDSSAIGADENTVTSPDNDNPYGTLITNKSICSGYSSTFQLMMDMVGIECITVEGTAHQGTEEHAWNMVKLDDEWYVVDVTWDDPVSNGKDTGRVSYTFFNVTSDFIRNYDHQWNEDGIPVADSSKYSYR